MVSVTPMALPDSGTWEFAVRLNTHIAPITQDLTAVSALSDGTGHEEKPIAWQGDPPGGPPSQGRPAVQAHKPAARSP